MKPNASKSDSLFESVKLRTFSNGLPKEDAPLIDIKSDKRVQLTKIFISIIFLVSMLGVFMADKVSSDAFLVTVLFSILLFSNFLGFVFLRNDTPTLLVFSLFCIYVWIAFPFKTMLALYDPMTLWVSHSFFEPNEVLSEIAGAFIAIFPGLLFLFVGFYIINIKFRTVNTYSIIKINHMKFILIIVMLMVLRVVIQLFLDIGIPGAKPKFISIPFAVGVLELLTRPVLLALVNLYLYYVIRLNDKKWIKIALLLTIINIILGLRVGYKSELVLQVLLLMYYLFDVFPHISKANRKFMALFTAAMLMAMIILYPLVNHYRSYLLKGEGFSDAIDSAQVRTSKEESNFALTFLNRINGIGAFYAAKKLGENESYGIGSLFNDDVMDLIKYKLYGSQKDKAVTAFGTTQFSVFYLIGGGVFLALSSLIVGIVIRLTSNLLRTKLFKITHTFSAYLPLLCIFWVKLLSSGGNIMLYIKELVLVVICLMLLERFGLVLSKEKKV